MMKKRKNSFRRTVDEWLDEAEGDEGELAEQIVNWIEIAEPEEIRAMAEYVAKELLADREEEE